MNGARLTAVIVILAMSVIYTGSNLAFEDEERKQSLPKTPTKERDTEGPRLPEEVRTQSSQRAEDPTVAAFRKLGGEFLADGFKASWSPDGTRLVFGKQEAPFGDRGDGLAILRLASGKITKLTDSGKDPAWSPGKGRWIAYVDGGYGTNEEVWIVKPSGKKRRKLVDGGYPSWSPDGTEVYYHSRKGRKIMAIKVDVAGAEPKEILASTWWYPVFSPDGNRVAYRSGARLILAECATGKILKEYPMLGGRGFLGNWSPDGKSIGYGGYGHHDTPGLWILDVETGGVRQLSKGFFTMPEWSPDGTKLAVGLRLRDGFQVWMIDAKALPPATAEPNATAITPRFDDPKVQATSRGKLPRCLCSTGRTRQTRHRIPVSFGHVCRPADPRRSSRGNTDGTPLRRLERMFLSVPRGTGHIQADCREGPTFSAEKLANSCKRSRIRHRRRKIVSAFP